MNTTDFVRSQYPDCPSLVAQGGGVLVAYPHLQGPPFPSFSPGGTSVDKNALAILNSNLIPLPNAPFGCNLSVANYNAASPDPTDPNRCYDAAVSPSTYWREELFRIDQVVDRQIQSVVSLHSRLLGYDGADPAVELPEHHPPLGGDVPHRSEPFLWAGHKPGGAADEHHLAHAAERFRGQLREFEHYS